MAAPDYVPAPVDDTARVYHSPPWRPDPWADRPAEIAGRQPLGSRLGTPGPDQGYALHLGERMRGRLSLTLDESEDDALAGCIAIGMRRSALFGRAPVIHDLTVALTLWGFLGDAPTDLVAVRTRVFAAVAHTHHYMERRAIVDSVPEDVLRLSPEQVSSLVRDEPGQVLAMAATTLAAQHHDTVA